MEVRALSLGMIFLKSVTRLRQCALKSPKSRFLCMKCEGGILRAGSLEAPRETLGPAATLLQVAARAVWLPRVRRGGRVRDVNAGLSSFCTPSGEIERGSRAKDASAVDHFCCLVGALYPWGQWSACPIANVTAWWDLAHGAYGSMGYAYAVYSL